MTPGTWSVNVRKFITSFKKRASTMTQEKLIEDKMIETLRKQVELYKRRLRASEGTLREMDEILELKEAEILSNHILAQNLQRKLDNAQGYSFEMWVKSMGELERMKFCVHIFKEALYGWYKKRTRVG